MTQSLVLLASMALVLLAARFAVPRIVEEIRYGWHRGELRAEYEQFLHEHSTHWLDDYALFRALKSAHGERPWPEWDKGFVHRDSNALNPIVFSQSQLCQTLSLFFEGEHCEQ